MITERDHPAYIDPNENEVVWRYINLEKFASLLKRKALFFCRADRFPDPFEGSIPRREADHRIEELESVSNYFGDTFNPEKARENIKALSHMHKIFKRASVISCWHLNSNESDAMWNLYLKSNEGIAVKTTINNLIKSFNNTNEEIGISKVRYIDFEQDIWYDKANYPVISYNFRTPLVHKRKEFKHESELRLIHHIEEARDNEDFWDLQENDKGKFINVDLKILIEEIILPPTVDNKIEIKISKLLSDHNLTKPVRKSKLLNLPTY